MLEDLQAQLVRLTRDLDELRRTVTGAAEAADTAAPPPPPPPPSKPAAAAPVRLGELAGWVQDWLLPTFRRMPGGARGRWCLRWWDHPEAVVRLSALHCSYRELLVPGGTGPGVWLRDHLDPALERLLGNEGPFATCSTDPVRHDPLDPLPTQALPEGLADISTLGGARPETGSARVKRPAVSWPPRAVAGASLRWWRRQTRRPWSCWSSGPTTDTGRFGGDVERPPTWTRSGFRVT